MPGYRRVAARDELRSKTMDLALAELSAPDPDQVLRKRLCEEMDVLRGILRKAEIVVRRNADKGRPEPRRGKDGRFLAAEAQSETMDVDRTPCAKRRKAMLPVEIIEPLPRLSKADPIPCAKKKRTMSPVEIIEPRISKDEISSLVTRLLSLSTNMPGRIVEFLNKECTGHTDEKTGEIQIDLGSMTHSAMFELQKLLDEFAEEDKRWQQKEESMNVCRSISRPSPPEPEEGEFIEQDGCATATTDTCGDDASTAVTRKDLCSRTTILEEGEMTEEDGVICGEAGPVATAETAESPSNTSSSGSSSSSDGSSRSFCSDSSDSDSSDSDSDDECVTSNVAQTVLPIPKTDASTMPAKCLCPPPQILEDGEMTEEEEVDICGDASPIAIEKSVQSAKSHINNSSSSSSSGSLSSDSRSSGSSSCSDSSDSESSDSGSEDKCVTSNPAPVVQSKTNAFPMAMPPKILSPIAETKNSRRSNSSLLEDGEIEEEQEFRGASPMAAEKFAGTVNSAVSANAQCIRSSLTPAISPKPSKPQPAAQGAVHHFQAMGLEKKREKASAAQSTVRHLYANGFEKKRERAAAAQGTVCHLYANAFEKTRERQRAYEKLEEMERNAKAKPIFDWIHPAHLRQLGITTSVEYAVTSERRLPSRCGCPVQSLLGLFLKAE